MAEGSPQQGRETGIGGQRRAFVPTAWSEVLRARDGSTQTARDAMGRLIDLYWKPVYFYIRRRGHDVEDAKDLTQQYFALFMERGALLAVDPAKGKFRTFILKSLGNFLCDEYDRRKAKKRQPGLDFGNCEAQYCEDNTFERDWAMVVLDRAFSRLKERSPTEAQVVAAQRTGKTRYKELAETLETTEANVKVLAHRGRKKLRAIIIEELKGTVSKPGDEIEELADLFKAFSL